MPKRFYVSTQKDRTKDADTVREGLTAHGWEVTFDWAKFSSKGKLTDEEFALAELDGVRRADLLIVLLPGGFGTHTELGAALALGKPVIIHASDKEKLENPYRCVFHYHPLVKMVISPSLDLAEVIRLFDDKDSVSV